jgi:YqjK-like protein
VNVEQLVRRSTEQRATLLAEAAPLVRRARSVDRVVSYVWRYPVLTSVVVGAIALAGPRRVLDFGARALTLYTLLRGRS